MCGSTGYGSPPERWFYAYVNLRHEHRTLEESRVDYGALDFVATVPALKDAGYRVVVLASPFLASQFHLRPDNQDEAAVAVRANLKKVLQACAENCIEVIPEVMPVGASGAILKNAPWLAEGTPVRGCEYEVRASGGRLVAEVAGVHNLVAAGEMNATLDDLRQTWNVSKQDAERFHLDADETLRITGPAPAGPSPDGSATTGTDEAFIEFGQNELAVLPRHQYRLRYRIKTADMLGTGNIGHYVAVNGRYAQPVPITRAVHPVKASQCWKVYETQINTYDSRTVSLWFGFKGFGSAGTVWIDDIALEKTGGVNLLRRPDDPATPCADEGLPITVTSSDGTIYCEGTDFDRWTDPCVGESGDYLHTCRPMPISIPASGSRIREGERLLVSYYHAALPSAEAHRVCCSLRHPEVLSLFRWQTQRLKELIGPKRWMINHDEIRAMGHDPLSRGDSPHQILGENLRACRKILKEVDPAGKVILMNDMYDPEHNAVCQDVPGRSYFPMVNGSFAGSAAAIEGGLTIWNWSLADSDIQDRDVVCQVTRSFRFFQNRCLSQVVAGFYDQANETPQAAHDRALAHFCAVAAAGVRPSAVCYYTNARDTRSLAPFAKAADEVWP